MVFEKTNISKLLGDLQDPIVVISDRGTIVELNTQAQQGFGYTHKELVGQNVSRLVPGEHKSLHDGYIQRFLETGEKNIIGIGREVKVEAKNGELLDYHLSVSQLESDGQIYFIGLLRDISLLKEKEVELEQKTSFFNELFNLSDLGFVRTDENGKWILLNEAMVDILGFDPMVEGREISLKDLMSENQDMTDGRNEITLQGVDERRIYLRYHRFSVTKDEGFQWLIFEDITVEKELRANLYYSLNMAAIGEFVAGVAHEVNNPLAIIMSSASLVQKKCKEGRVTPEQICNYMDQIIESVRRASSVTNGLRGQSILDPNYKEVFSAHMIINQTVAIAKEVFSEAKIEVTKYEKASEDFIESNPGKLQQVLMHLFKNSRDALEGREDKRLDIVTMNYSDRFEISISDNGIGIDKELIEKIFSPFFSTKSVGDGMGLGLTYVSKMVSEMKGQIRVNSFPGEGTQFIISIPYHKGDHDYLKGKEDFEFEPFPESMRVLVVDDDKEQLKMIKELITPWNLDVTTLSDPFEVLRILKEGTSFDFILTDIQMPEMDGVELLDKIKNILPEVHVALNTGGYSLNLSSSKRELIRNKADSFFVKPLNMVSLYKMMKKVSLLEIV